MEGLPVVCYSTGTMNSVLGKLTMLKNQSNPADEFSGEAGKLENKLRTLKEKFVDKLSGRPVTQKQLKVCMKQVRELVFNIEDWIDQKVFNIEDWIDQKPETNLVVDPSGEQKFKYFEAKIDATLEHLEWYFALFKIESTEAGLTPIPVTINPRLLVEEKSCHGVLGGPRDYLVKHLTDDEEEMRKVVSVVGMEGLGKTSLAKEIYSELQLRQLFECQAFVSVGRRPAMRKILEDILGQVNPGITKLGLQGIVHMQEIVTKLRKYLGTKRYFIVVDGIWSTWAWKIINCVLPNNNRRSRVLTTTCINYVARSCSSYPNDIVYQMEALSEENSRILLWAGSKDDSYMLKLCGGIPLAIIVAAGLLLARNSEAPAEVNMLQKSIYCTSDGMTKILHMSYDDLSLPARSCFIYLSVFREYETIMKDRLIRLWGAEGFIPKRDEECWWVTGERYFNELISRRLIQPVFTYDDDQAVGCTVHTVILDFIRSISREENFATRAIELNSSPFPCDTIRRFSLDCGMEDEAVHLYTSSLHLSSMRSLTVFGDVRGKIYPPDSPPDDESISDPQRLSSVSKHEEMHDRAMAFEARMRQQQSRMQSRRVIKDDEGKHDPPDSRAADERISGPEGLRSDSKQDEAMHATKAPGVGMMDQPSSDVERIQGKHDPPDSLAADVRISDPEGLPSDSKQGEDMEAPRVPTKILSAFKLLRVLDLQDTKNLENDHLEGIGGLVLLRYLGLAGTGITMLPKEIGELVLLRYLGLAGTGIAFLPNEIGQLEQLETLDLRKNGLTIFPESRVNLKKVRHLLLQEYTEDIWEMPELEEASGICVKTGSVKTGSVKTGSSSSLRTVVELLRKSEKLRMLGLIFSGEEPTEIDLVSFLEEVVKSKLQSISIGFRCSSLYRVIPKLFLKSWESVTAPPAKEFEPQRFELRITGKTDGGLMQVPGNMGSLASLTHLHIGLGEAKAEGFLVLGGLTNLVLLRLVAEGCLQGEKFTIKGGMFPCLKVFSFIIKNTWMGLEFEKGAMPQLQRLGRGFRVRKRRNQAYPDIGIEHLTSLSRIHATINCQDVEVPEVESAEAAIRGEISKIATKPALELSRQ